MISSEVLWGAALGSFFGGLASWSLEQLKDRRDRKRRRNAVSLAISLGIDRNLETLEDIEMCLKKGYSDVEERLYTKHFEAAIMDGAHSLGDDGVLYDQVIWCASLVDDFNQFCDTLLNMENGKYAEGEQPREQVIDGMIATTLQMLNTTKATLNETKERLSAKVLYPR